MKKRPFKKKNEEIRISLGSLVLMLCCVCLLIFSTFLTIDVFYPVIPTAQDGVNGFNISHFFKTFEIIPQIPAVIFVGAILGRRLGIASVLLYILIGLFVLPVFALGGGLSYFAQHGFGYILAYIPAVWLLTKFLKNGLSFKNILLGSLLSVLLVHFVGVIYMSIMAMIHGDGINFVKGWIIYQSGWKIFFDFMVSFALCYAVKAFAFILWCYRKPY